MSLSIEKEKIFKKLLLEKGLQRQDKAIIDTIPKRETQSRYELSFQQQQIWFLSRAMPDSPAYNVPYVLKFTGIIDIEKINRVINKIIARHEILRTVFVEEDGIPYQIINDNFEIKIKVKKSYIPQETILNEIKKETSLPFNLFNSPLIRAVLFPVTEEINFFAITVHHLITDGCSMNILLQEFSTLYKDESQQLTEISVQYADYVQWQKQYIQSAKWAEDETYWLETFQTIPADLNLLTKRKNSLIGSPKGKMLPFTIDNAILDPFVRFCNKHNTTLFSGLIAAYQILLFWYTSQKDIVIGTPSAGRTVPGLRNTLGYFINTLPLRTAIEKNDTYENYLIKVKITLENALFHQNYPFQNLVKRLKLPHDMNRSPLFQTMFTMQDFSCVSMNINNLETEVICVDNQYAQFPLSITVWKIKENLTGSWEYDEELFDEKFITNLIEHYKFIIINMVENPQSIVTKEPILLPWEKKLVCNNNLELPLYQRTVYDLFQEQVELKPGNRAIVFHEKDITYRELSVRVDQWGSYLKKLGVKKDFIILLHADITIDIIAVILSIVKIGAIYVPVDTHTPFERLEYIINDTNPYCIISNDTFEIFDKSIHVYFDAPLSKFSGVVQKQSSEFICTVFTSGSTGTPKGVLMRNDAVTNLIESFLSCYRCSEKDKMIPMTSISSSSFIGEIFPMLCVGGTLVLLDKTDYLDFNILNSVLEKEHVTIISTVSSVISKLNQTNIIKGALRLILSGGEPLFLNDINNLINKVTFVNGYGLTEATVCSTYHIIKYYSDESIDNIIGKPIKNTSVYVLNPDMNILPVKSVGELYIGGIGISPGYVNDPILTQETFVQSPFCKNDRLLKTGDLAYWNFEGQLVYCSRKDEQIKIRGFRININEIQSAINKHPLISDSAVYYVDHQNHEGILKAVLVLKKEKEPLAEDFTHWLANRLPLCMIPQVFMVTEEIPRNLNGKIDQKKLSSTPFRLLSGKCELLHTNLTTTEEKVSLIWRQLLKRDQVPVNENFFDLGGHSLLLTQLQSKLNDISRKQISIIDLFRYTTIASQSQFIDSLENNTIKTPENHAENICKVTSRGEMRRRALQTKYRENQEGNNNE